MNLYLMLIVGFLLVSFIVDVVVEILNLRAFESELPAEFRDTYNDEKYRKSQLYMLDNTQFSMVAETISLLVTIAFIFLGGFNLLDIWVRGWDLSQMATGLAYFAVLGIGLQIFGLPFSIYRTFVIEQQYGFNKTTYGTFIGDRCKGLLLSVLIGGPLLALVLWFFSNFPVHGWWYAWLGLSVAQVVILFVAPTLIMPLFNKFERLPEGELREAIESYAKKQEFKVSGLFTMDGSRRSNKSNAFFTGIGKFRRIVLFDTLIKSHSTTELVAILAHEVGHFKMKHIIKSMILSFGTSGLLFYAISLFLNSRPLHNAFFMENVSVYTSLIFILFLYGPISKIISIVESILSRKHEYEADAYAINSFGHKEEFVSALKRLSADNLSNLTPHPWKVFLEYSHPPVLMRIQSIRKL